MRLRYLQVRDNRRLSRVLFSFLAAGLSFFSIKETAAQTVDRIVAIVNEEVITQSDINTVMAAIETELKTGTAEPGQLQAQLAQTRRHIIRQMVEEKLILSEARKQGFNADEEKINVRIAELKNGFPSEEDFEIALQMQGLTLTDLKARFCDQELMKKAVDYFVRSKIKVDPMEVTEFYQQNQEQFLRDESVRVESILIKVGEYESEAAALEKAQEILQRLKDGQTFEQLAKDYGPCVSVTNAEDLGLVAKGQLIPELDEAIFALNPGEFTPVLKTNQGLRIFKVEEKNAARTLTLAQAQDEIRQLLFSQKFNQRFGEWLGQLKESAFISIKEKTPEEHPGGQR